MGKKHSEAKPGEKLLMLYSRLLFTRQKLSLTKLANELQCSKPTVGRLIAQIEAARYGTVREEKNGREIEYYLDRPARPPQVSINSEGLEQLALCRSFLLNLMPAQMRKNIDAALTQAVAYGSSDEPVAQISAQSYAKGRINYTPFEGIIKVLTKALKGQKVCRITYQTQRHLEPSVYSFAPKRLETYHESIFVQGWVVSEKGTAQPKHSRPTTLAIQRIRHVEIMPRNAAKLPELPPIDHSAFGIAGHKPFSAVVRFAPRVATYISEREWSSDQKMTFLADGSVKLRFTAVSKDEVRAWALSFGANAEVLSPKWLRQDVASELEQAKARYGANGKKLAPGAQVGQARL